MLVPFRIESAPKAGGRGTSGRPISEQLLALQSHEMVEHGNVQVSFFKDEFAGNETGSPFEFLGTMLLAVGSDIFLGNPKHNRSYFRPDAGTRAHGTRF